MGNVTNLQAGDDEGFLDLNARQVHVFAQRMANLGYAEMTTQLMAMFRSQVWQRFTTGLGEHVFLPGEFDYFLTQQGVKREDVMRGVREVELKAELEAAMDERRTGEEGYRRGIKDVREQVPTRPGRTIEPFGLTRDEAKALVERQAAGRRLDRPPLGKSIRRYSNTGGRTTVDPSDARPRWMQLRNSAERLPDTDLEELLAALQAEKRRRRKTT
jgi:hypothetical protein